MWIWGPARQSCHPRRESYLVMVPYGETRPWSTRVSPDGTSQAHPKGGSEGTFLYTAATSRDWNASRCSFVQFSENRRSRRVVGLSDCASRTLTTPPPPPWSLQSESQLDEFTLRNTRHLSIFSEPRARRDFDSGDVGVHSNSPTPLVSSESTATGKT